MAHATDYEKMGITVGDLKTRSERHLVAGDTGAVYARTAEGRTGSLLFLRRGALLSQRFDPARLSVEGEPSVVAPQVLYESAMRYANLSATANGVIAYMTGAPNRDVLTWFDRTGTRLGMLGEPGEYTALQVSPDQRQIALNRRDPNTGRPEIWTIDLDRGTASRISADGLDEEPVWSPNGNEVVFANHATFGGRAPALRSVPAGGGQQRQLMLFPVSADADPTDWSSDGHYLAYRAYSQENGEGIYVLPFHGGPSADPGKPWVYLDTKYNERGAVFIPSGSASPHWIAYFSDESGRDEVYLRSFPSPARRMQVSPSGGREPCWSRDGKELYYVSPQGNLMAVEVRGGGRDISVSAPRLLFHIGFNIGMPGITPYGWLLYAPVDNGHRFLVVRKTEDPQQSISVLLNPRF